MNLKFKLLFQMNIEPITLERGQQQCPLCPKIMKKTLISRHILIHTGKRPFACSECTYKCSRRDNLKKHFEKLHIVKKEFGK